MSERRTLPWASLNCWGSDLDLGGEKAAPSWSWMLWWEPAVVVEVVAAVGR